MYQKFVENGGEASILHFKFSPASVIPGIQGYLRIQGYPRIPGIYLTDGVLSITYFEIIIEDYC